MSRVLTDAILSALATETGKQIGDAEAPTAAVFPYAVLYPIPSVDHDGDLADADRERGWTYQVTSVGTTREQTQWMADQVEAGMRAATLAPAGLNVMGVETQSRGAVQRDDAATATGTEGGTVTTVQPLFYSVDTYVIHTSR